MLYDCGENIHELNFFNCRLSAGRPLPKKTSILSPYFSEFALIYYRLIVEVRWLEALAANPDIPEVQPLTEDDKDYLAQILNNFNEEEAEKVKTIEKKTNHDVKAIEYYLKENWPVIPG